MPSRRKTVMTVSGIRPDFIRMSAIFKKLDQEFNHVLVHTGQHYDRLLSGVFFEDLDIREPDHTLVCGKAGGGHQHQLGYLSTALIDLIREKDIQPDIIIFLGDSNTVCAALPLRKEGYVIGHVEAGMRSHDKRMLEEINRTVCDHCSHICFVYHDDYRVHLENENIKDNIHVVGNTIVEVAKKFLPTTPKRLDQILVDIHRPENYKSPGRMRNLLSFANRCKELYNLPVRMLRFHGTCRAIEEHNLELGEVELTDLMSYKEYLDTIHHCKFLVSDSGTGQEEPALCNTPVVVPRDYTERPQSIDAGCSVLLSLDDLSNAGTVHSWLEAGARHTMDTSWLGDGDTAEKVVRELHTYLEHA